MIIDRDRERGDDRVVDVVKVISRPAEVANNWYRIGESLKNISHSVLAM